MHPTKRRASRWASAIAGVIALLFAPDCADDRGLLGSGGAGGDGGSSSDGGGGSGGAGGGAAAGATITAAFWSLTWDKSRTTEDAGGGWSVETDLGYRVHVTSGWILDHSVSLGLCDATTARSPRLRLGIRAAHAHDDPNPSAIELLHAEDLATPGDAGPFPSLFPPARYCRVHWLVARPTSPSDAPAGVALSNTSARVAGTWEQGGAPHDFAIDTWWPHGRLVELEAAMDPAALAAAQAADGASAVNVTVRRDLGALFDGIDFATATDDQLAGLLLDNLAEKTELHVQRIEPGGS